MDWSVLPPAIQHCLKTVQAAGWAVYPVGGCVRDLLLGRQPGDVDACTAALPEDIMALFGKNAVPTGLRHGTITVLTDDGAVEITTFRRETGYADGRHPDAVRFGIGLEEDLSRRDFTINAMALSADGEIIDRFGGRADLSAGLIRCVGEPDRRFAEDALRMLRAVRFAAQLGFELEPDTTAALRRNAARTVRVSRERIRAEMEKTLLSPRPERIGDMAEAGLLSHLHVFPQAVDYSGLSGLSCTPEERWRGFCTLTGFPISTLPVERKLRRAVEHPELAVIPTLALKAADLMELGLTGPAIGAVQKALALHVLTHPTDNTPDRLRLILNRKS